MNIADNILKYYLRNCYFINGTAYAGKSTMCRMLAEKYNMIHCEENYNMDTILSVVTPELQLDLNYFNENHSMHDLMLFVGLTAILFIVVKPPLLMKPDMYGQFDVIQILPD